MQVHCSLRLPGKGDWMQVLATDEHAACSYGQAVVIEIGTDGVTMTPRGPMDLPQGYILTPYTSAIGAVMADVLRRSGFNASYP